MTIIDKANKIIDNKIINYIIKDSITFAKKIAASSIPLSIKAGLSHQRMIKMMDKYKLSEIDRKRLVLKFGKEINKNIGGI